MALAVYEVTRADRLVEMHLIGDAGLRGAKGVPVTFGFLRNVIVTVALSVLIVG
jgi:hypothetical protein